MSPGAAVIVVVCNVAGVALIIVGALWKFSGRAATLTAEVKNVRQDVADVKAGQGKLGDKLDRHIERGHGAVEAIPSRRYRDR